VAREPIVKTVYCEGATSRHQVLFQVLAMFFMALEFRNLREREALLRRLIKGYSIDHFV
jgi:hypothetical protein